MLAAVGKDVALGSLLYIVSQHPLSNLIRSNQIQVSTYISLTLWDKASAAVC